MLNGRSSSLYNLTNVEARTRHLIKYINAYAVSTESVLYINEQDYTKFLLKEEIIPSQYMKSGNKINGDMEQVKTTRKHRTIVSYMLSCKICSKKIFHSSKEISFKSVLFNIGGT